MRIKNLFDKKFILVVLLAIVAASFIFYLLMPTEQSITISSDKSSYVIKPSGLLNSVVTVKSAVSDTLTIIPVYDKLEVASVSVFEDGMWKNLSLSNSINMDLWSQVTLDVGRMEKLYTEPVRFEAGEEKQFKITFTVPSVEANGEFHVVVFSEKGKVGELDPAWKSIEPKLIERGKNYEIKNNFDGTYTWTSGTDWVSNGTGYAPYVFQDRYSSDGYYQVQVGLVGAKLYDDYIQIFKPDLSVVEVQNEQWILQHFDAGIGKGQWRDAALSNLRWSVTKTDKYVEIKKTWDTSYASVTGVLEVVYRFEEKLKHTVRWRNTTAEWMEPRFEQKWTGINADTKHVSKDVGDSVRTGTGKDAVFVMNRLDGTMAVMEDQMSAIDFLNYSSVEVSAGGKKASFIFSGFDLSKPIEIDPTTTTLQPTTKDDFPYKNEPNTNHGTSTAVFVYTYSNPSRSLLTWDITSIPSGAAISNANLSLWSYSVIGTPTGRTYWMYENTRKDWVEAESTWNVYKTGSSWTAAGGDYSETNGASKVMPACCQWVNWTVTALIQSYRSSGYSTADFLLRDSSEDSSTIGTYFYSNNYATDTTKRPKLEITYTIPPTWQKQGTNDTDNLVAVGKGINLTAQGYDATALDWAVLSTNETGEWVNKTGSYSSPMNMNDAAATWTWSNFTWINSSVTVGSIVGWRIYYNNTVYDWNTTDIMSFTIVPGFNWQRNSTNSTTGNTTLFSVNWTSGVPVNNTGGFIFSFDNGTGTFVNDSYSYFGELPQNSSEWYGSKGLWHLNDGSGNAADWSNNGKTGTITGATWVTNGSCRFGSCLYFDGNDHINVATYNIAPTNTYTMSAWIRTSTTGKYVFGQGDDTGSTNEMGIGVDINSNHARALMDRYAGNWFYGEGTTTVTDNKWHMVTLVYDNSNYRLYVDGSQEATGTFTEAGSATSGNQFFAIGSWSRNDAAIGQFIGYIDDVAVWNRALSAVDVANLYNSSKFFATQGWSNVTKIVNTTAGSTIRWQVYANNTDSVWNTTGTMSFVIPGGACSAPGSGSWSISSNCTSTINTIVRGVVQIINNARFEITSGSRLDIKP